MKAVVINGSPRIKNTSKALRAYAEYLRNKLGLEHITYMQIPNKLRGCINCSQCRKGCRFDDGFQDILERVKESDVVVLGTPVYLDMPTSQTVALLTRLNCMAESTGREFFKNKSIYLLATSYCSGTKKVLGILMNACEMLGFNIPPRSTREWSEVWKDNKLRGGLDAKKDAIYIDME